METSKQYARIEKKVIFFIGGRLPVNKILHVTNRDVRKMITIAER
jgi:hypothetical protein